VAAWREAAETEAAETEAAATEVAARVAAREAAEREAPARAAVAMTEGETAVAREGVDAGGVVGVGLGLVGVLAGWGGPVV